MAQSMGGLNLSVHDLIVNGQLFELYDQMMGITDVAEVLDKATMVVQEILDAERATTYLVLPETQELESASVVGNVRSVIKVPIQPTSLSGYCALTGKTFAIADAYGDLSTVDECLRFDRSWDEANGFRTGDVMCAPAIFKGEVLGVVQVINKRNGKFTEADLLPLQSVCRFVAIALNHARVYDELTTLQGINKQKANFMRVMVHELKRPVSSSKSLVSALEFTNRDNEQLGMVLGRIGTRLDELLVLIKDVIYLSKVKGGGALGEVSVFDLAQETAVIMKQYEDQVQEKGLQMNLSVPDRPVPVRIDTQVFQLILSNLVSNAVKYTPAGNVEVALRTDEKWAIFDISDSGMGIPEADIPKLFTEFFRASNARESNIKGTGVGLAGVKELAERFDGRLTMKSEENVGSTFTVRLPLHRQA